MKAIEEKIGELENTVTTALSFIAKIKNDNALLLKENKRLQKEYNQLKKIVEESDSKRITEAGNIEDQKQSDTKIELVKKELDMCIQEMETYITQNSN